MSRPGISNSQLRLTPREYIQHAVFGLDKLLDLSPTQSLVVCGDIAVIADFRDAPFSLPPAKVLGDVIIKESPGLTSCALDIEGRLEITSCKNLEKLRGSAASVALNGTALRSIGADFNCHRDMEVRNTPSLSRLNCRVGLSLKIKGEVEVATGPAFYCGLALIVDGGAVLVDSQGRRHGGPLGSPARLMEGQRLSCLPSISSPRSTSSSRSRSK